MSSTFTALMIVFSVIGLAVSSFVYNRIRHQFDTTAQPRYDIFFFVGLGTIILEFMAAMGLAFAIWKILEKGIVVEAIVFVGVFALHTALYSLLTKPWQNRAGV
jgi:hypothetical protein